MCAVKDCNGYSVGFSDYCHKCNTPKEKNITHKASVNKYIIPVFVVGLVIGFIYGRLF
jgi:hypothetical protein